MAKENSFSSNDGLSNSKESPIDSLPTAKKKFIEPEISTPVDVLEATTFFQVASSGATN